MAFDEAALAQAGAQVIVTAMATDIWPQLRGRIGKLFGGGDEERQRLALANLDETQAALDAASSDEAARDAQVELRGQLKAELRADPELAAHFDALVREVAEQLGAAPQSAAVTQSARADRGSTVIQAGRDASTGHLPSPGRPSRR